jgi:hypothetical protein
MPEPRRNKSDAPCLSLPFLRGDHESGWSGYVADDAAFVAAVNKGLMEIEAGHAIPHEMVAALMEEHLKRLRQR